MSGVFKAEILALANGAVYTGAVTAKLVKGARIITDFTESGLVDCQHGGFVKLVRRIDAEYLTKQKLAIKKAQSDAAKLDANKASTENKSDDKTFDCPYCSIKGYKTLAGLNKHIAKIHPGNATL